MLSIGTNISSLKVQRSLSESSTSLEGIYRRLASGLRITGAGDDAAGLAVADSLRVQTRIQTKALQNINDGVSALNIIDGTLQAQSSIIMRLSEIAEQSANGVYSADQRKSMSAEYNALLSEFGRIGDTTEFNDISLLLGAQKGGISTLALQVGTSGSNQSILQILGAETGSLTGIIDISALPTSGSGSVSLEELRDHFTSGLIKATPDPTSGAERYIGFISDAGSGQLLDANIYTYDASSDTYTESGMASLSFSSSTGYMDSASVSTVLSASGLDARGLKFSDPTGVFSEVRSPTSAIDASGVESADGALQAIEILRRRLGEINSLQGSFGALQSRLSVANGVVQVSREAMTAAESRIRDADIAEESAALVSTTIKQQAGASVLKIANLQPELVLNLLRNA